MRGAVFLKKESLPSERGTHSGKLKEFYSSLKNGSHNRPFVESTIKAEHSIQLTLSVNTSVYVSLKTCICFSFRIFFFYVYQLLKDMLKDMIKDTY